MLLCYTVMPTDAAEWVLNKCVLEGHRSNISRSVYGPPPGNGYDKGITGEYLLCLTGT